MPPMTQARTRANEVGSPSLRQLSLAAMLRAFVELVLHAVSTLWMRWRCLSRDWHTDDAATALPEEKTGNQHQKPSSPATQGSSALILRDREAIVSKDEGVLTAPRSEPSGSGPVVRVPREGGGVDSHLKCNGLRWRKNASAGVFQPRALRGVAL